MRYNTDGKTRQEIAEGLAILCRAELNKLTPADGVKIAAMSANNIENLWLAGRHAALTKEGYYLGEHSKEEAKDYIEAITRLFDTFRLPATITAKRNLRAEHWGVAGIDFTPYVKGKANISELIGKTYREKGFCFFSAFLDFPKRPMEAITRPIAIYCDLPQGIKAIYSDPLSSEGRGETIGEIITQRGLSWRIVKAWREESHLCLKVMPLIGSDTPERLAKDLEEIA